MIFQFPVDISRELCFNIDTQEIGISEVLQGYQSLNYAKSFEHLGRIEWLTYPYHGMVLERGIPSTSYVDYCSIYPVFVPTGRPYFSSPLSFEDLKEKKVVSLTLVTDPLDNQTKDFLLLQKYVGSAHKDMGLDEIRPYKNHYVVKLQDPWVIANNHYRNIKKAVKNQIEVTNVTLHWTILPELADRVHNVYSNLCQRHNITGFPAFDRNQIFHQLNTPGAVLFQASKNGNVLGYMLFYLEHPNARYHIGCYTDEGYENCVSFILMYEAMHFFKQLGCGFLVLGGSSGYGEEDGLSRFKSGWTTYCKNNYILFKKINPKIYDELSTINTQYLPAYRVPQ